MMMLAGIVASLGAISEDLRALGIDIGSYRLSLYGLVTTIAVAILLYMLVRVTIRALRWILRRNPRLDDTQRLLTEKLTSIALFALAALVGIDLLGIDLTALTVFSGAAGLAVGFGLQKTIGNLIAGIILLMDRSVKPGDIIVVGEGPGGKAGVEDVGRVTKIGVRAVTVVTRDGKKHLIPNELLMTQAVENWSYSSSEVRVRMPIGVSYDSDLRLAQKLMVEAATANPRVLAEPAPVVWITAFGDSAILHELRLWISDPEMGLGNVQGEIYLAIYDSFAAHGVRLPHRQVDIHMRAGADGAAKPASGGEASPQG